MVLGCSLGLLGFIWYAQDLFFRISGLAQKELLVIEYIYFDISLLGWLLRGETLITTSPRYIPLGHWTLNAFGAAYALVGFYIGYILFHYLKKGLLFYIQSAHIIAVTKICIEDDTEHLVRDSFEEIKRRFVGVSLFMLADSLIFKATREIGNLILSQDTIPVIDENPTTILAKAKNTLVRLVGRSISATLNHCDELVLSYAFIQCRVRELYPDIDENSDEDTSDIKPERIVFKYVVDGICFYASSCINLLKSSFATNLSLDICSWVFAFLLPVVLFIVTELSIIWLPVIIIASRTLYTLIHYIFIDPYIDVKVVRTFYDTLFEMDATPLEQVRNALVSRSELFSQLVGVTAGIQANNAMSDATEPNIGDILNTNIQDDLLSSIEDMIGISVNHDFILGRNQNRASTTEVGDTQVGDAQAADQDNQTNQDSLTLGDTTLDVDLDINDFEDM